MSIHEMPKVPSDDDQGEAGIPLIDEGDTFAGETEDQSEGEQPPGISDPTALSD